MQASPATMNLPSDRVNSFAAISGPVTNESLVEALRRAMVDRRQVVEIGGSLFRFQKGGDVFEHDKKRMLALSSSIYSFVPVSFGGRTLDARWVALGAVSDIDVLMAPFLPRADKERESLWVGLADGAAMKEAAKDIRLSAPRRPTPYES